MLRAGISAGQVRWIFSGTIRTGGSDGTAVATSTMLAQIAQ
jgi:hypothetical protein